MLKISKKLLLITLVSIFTILLGIQNNVFAEEAEDVKLFVQAGCTYCEQVLDFLEQNSIQEGIQVIDVSESESNSSLFDEYAEKCDLNANYVPMIYINGECTSNAISVIEAISDHKGISEQKFDETPTDSEVEELNTAPIDNTEEVDLDTTLADAIDGPEKLPPVPWYAYIIIGAAVVCLAAITYLLINKMNV